MRNNRTAKLVLCGLFTALIAIGAFIRIDLIVPITLQSLFVVIAGQVLGAKGGAVSAAVYMLLGLAGLPVFAQGGGIMYILRPSFGYILGFMAGAFVTGLLARRRKAPSAIWLYFSGAAGLACVYALGLMYFCLIVVMYVKASGEELLRALRLTVFATLPIDLVLLLPASIIAKRIMIITTKHGPL